MKMSNTEKMPWENEGETFDAERAKTLVLNLRADKEDLQSKLTAKTQELSALATAKEEAEAKLTEVQSLQQELEEKLSTATNELTATQLLRTKEQILSAKGLPADLADLLTGEDEETLTTAAERLAALRPAESKPAVDTRPNPAQTGTPATDPKQEWAEAVFGAAK